MKNLFTLLTLLFLTCAPSDASPKPKKNKKVVHKQIKQKSPSKSKAAPLPQKIRALYPEERMNLKSKVRGWDYLYQRLKKEGVSQKKLDFYFKNSALPWFTFIPYKLEPKEPADWYAGFYESSKVQKAREFLIKNKTWFDKAESKYGVQKEAIAALLLVETQYGLNTGSESVFYRLARLASAHAPENITRNLKELQKEDARITHKQAAARSQYLEDTFLPELLALFSLAEKRKINALHMQGSSAGAFGLPQFLPRAYMSYGVDADGDGIVSLFTEADAILSVAAYLKAAGWKSELPSQKAALWNYNKSEFYGRTILDIAKALSRDTQ